MKKIFALILSVGALCMITASHQPQAEAFPCGPTAQCWDKAYNICCTNNKGIWWCGKDTCN